MKIAEFAIDNRVTTYVLTVMFLVGGLAAYQNMARLEDPEFTIKEAVIITPYPGATPREVEEEVTDEVEKAIQKLGQLHQIKYSLSYRGLSIVQAEVKDKYDKDTLPQVWDELRRKVNDMQGQLPPGAGPSIVNDDFGDVYGIFAAMYGPEYSYAELKRLAEYLRRELLLVQDVAKIEFFGIQDEVVYVELDRDRMSQLGIPAEVIVNELREKNVVSSAGRVEVGTDFIAIDPTGLFHSVDDFESLLLTGAGSARQIFLRDVATVRRGYKEPATSRIRFDGHPAIGIGISTVSGGNVVTMGEGIKEKFQDIQREIPIGVEFGLIAVQSDAVTTAINGFVVSLLQAVAIVIIVLLFFMGLRSGLLIGFILVLTIAGSFIFMAAVPVTLERISLGALIIALGMLVDNAIVVVDGMLVGVQRGLEPRKAATDVVAKSAMPLLGATVVAVLAFAAIGTSQDSTGEYCRSLFQVILISLMFSWVTAVTVTPLAGISFLKAPGAGSGADPYGGGFYRMFRNFLGICLRFRWITVGVVAAVFALSVYGFGFVENSFFPDSTRPQFMVDFWLPQGTHIDETTRQATEIEEHLQGLDGVTHVATVVGQGALRFLLTYTPEKANSAFAQFLVEVEDYRTIPAMMAEVQAYIEDNYPDSVPSTRRFILGPGEPGKIQARFFGPDPDVLRKLASQAAAIMHTEPNLFNIRTDWRQRVKVIRPVLAEEQANLNGISRRDVANAIRQGFEGVQVGIYREGDELLPILLRAPEEERGDVASLNNLQIWSRAAGRMIPLRQVVSGFETDFEDDIIVRVDRRRAIKVIADPRVGNASPIFSRIRPPIEAIPLPEGYTLEWWGEVKDSAEAQEALASKIPFFLLAMILVVIVLFNNLRQPLVIWLTVPLAIIGVSAGLLLTRQPFGFMALLGFLSLSGMLIKNAIVLIDEINLQVGEGKRPFDAVVDSAVSRLRPVAMAAVTTILGMVPLFKDAFFIAMAVTICFGLGFATLLTMIVVPTFYSIFYRVPCPADGGSTAATPGN